jgi:hypothetical protein
MAADKAMGWRISPIEAGHPGCDHALSDPSPLDNNI